MVRRDQGLVPKRPQQSVADVRLHDQDRASRKVTNIATETCRTHNYVDTGTTTEIMRNGKKETVKVHRCTICGGENYVA